MDVSVIIPTYKPGDYIWQCLNSLKDQTLSYDKYELIIVVNGCCEPYYSDILSYLDKCNQRLYATVLQTDKGGVSNARNMGLDVAKGQYVCFIDDDDWVSPTYLEGLLSAATGVDSVVVANVKNYDENTSFLRDDWLTACYDKNREAPDRASLMSCRSFMSVACCKLTALEAIGEYRFDTRFKQGEDSLFNATMSHRLKKFCIAPPDAIYFRRIRQNSAARSRSLKCIFRDNIVLAWAFVKIYLRNADQYNFRFFVTRILGCLKAVIRALGKR